MNLDEYKKAYPAVANVPDDVLVGRLYDQYGKGMDKDTFNAKLGYKPTYVSETKGAASELKDLYTEHPIKSVATTGVGMAENALSMLTGYGATALSGLANVVVTDESAQAIRDKLTYLPHTDTGKAMAKLMAVPFSALERTSEGAGEAVRADTKGAGADVSGFLGAAAKMGVWAPAILLGRSTGKPVEFMRDEVSKPVRAAAGEAVKKATEGPERQAARNVEERAYQADGEHKALLDNLTRVQQGWDRHPKTPEEVDHIREYMEDETGNYPLTPHEELLYKNYIEPYRQEMGHPPGYFPRISKEHESPVTAYIAKHGQPSITAKLSTKVQSEKGRAMFKLVPVGHDAPEMVVHFEPKPFTERTFKMTGFRDKQPFEMGDARIINKDNPVGAVVRGPDGKQWEVKQATVGEIERHSASTYIHNPMVAIAETYRQVKTKELTQRFLADVKNENKALFRDSDDVSRPADYKPLTSPFFKDKNGQPVYAHPLMARVINAFTGERGKGAQALHAMSSAILNVTFAIPLWHQLNELNFWLTERTPRLGHPEVWAGLPKNFGKAFKEVTQSGDDYLHLVKAGYPMMKARVVTPEAYRAVVESLLKEVDTPAARTALEKAKLPIGVVKSGVNWYLKNVVHSVWPAQDMLTMEAIYERMQAKKIPLEQAADEVFTAFPQYRISYSGRVSHIFANASDLGLTWFMPYHVDRVRVLWDRVAGTVTGDPEKASQLMGTMFMAFVVYPQIDQALRKASGNDQARIERFGEARVLQGAKDVAERKKPMSSLISLMVTINPVLTSGVDVEQSYREMRKKGGKYPPVKEQAKIIGKDVGSNLFYPFANYQEVGGNLEDTALAQAGVFLPKKKKKP